MATIVSNHVVNALGPTFVSRLVAEQGAEPADVVRAYRIARDVTGAEQRWAAVEQLAGVDRQAQWTLLEGIDELVESTARWYLENAPGVDLGTAIATGREGFGRLLALLPKLDERREALSSAAAALVEQGVPDDMAHAHAYLTALGYAPDVIAAAGAVGRSVEDAGMAFVLLRTASRSPGSRRSSTPFR